jgi:hypothetical protein
MRLLCGNGKSQHPNHLQHLNLIGCHDHHRHRQCSLYLHLM